MNIKPPTIRHSTEYPIRKPARNKVELEERRFIPSGFVSVTGWIDQEPLEPGAWWLSPLDQLVVRFVTEDAEILETSTQKIVREILHLHHDSILDVGGFTGHWAWLFRAKRKVVVDLCCEALEMAQVVADETHCMDAKDIGQKFGQGEFDVVFLIDILEHMEKGAGLNCLFAAEEIAKHQVIVASPVGYFKIDETHHPGIVTQEQEDLTRNPAIVHTPCAELHFHRSGWQPDFFERKGYEAIIQPDLHKDIGGKGGFVAWRNLA